MVPRQVEDERLAFEMGIVGDEVGETGGRHQLDGDEVDQGEEQQQSEGEHQVGAQGHDPGSDVGAGGRQAEEGPAVAPGVARVSASAQSLAPDGPEVPPRQPNGPQGHENQGSVAFHVENFVHPQGVVFGAGGDSCPVHRPFLGQRQPVEHDEAGENIQGAEIGDGEDQGEQADYQAAGDVFTQVHLVLAEEDLHHGQPGHKIGDHIVGRGQENHAGADPEQPGFEQPGNPSGPVAAGAQIQRHLGQGKGQLFPVHPLAVEEHEDAESEDEHAHGHPEPLPDRFDPSAPGYAGVALQAVPEPVYDPRFGAGEHVPGQDVEQEFGPLILGAGDVGGHGGELDQVPHPAVGGNGAHHPSGGEYGEQLASAQGQPGRQGAEQRVGEEPENEGDEHHQRQLGTHRKVEQVHHEGKGKDSEEHGAQGDRGRRPGRPGGLRTRSLSLC